VNPINQHAKTRASKLRAGADSEIGPKEMLDVLLALDRMLVEVSMRLYHVSQNDQLTMRKHNRQLHNAVRAQLPRLLRRSRRQL